MVVPYTSLVWIMLYDVVTFLVCGLFVVNINDADINDVEIAVGV